MWLLLIEFLKMLLKDKKKHVYLIAVLLSAMVVWGFTSVQVVPQIRNEIKTVVDSIKIDQEKQYNLLINRLEVTNSKLDDLKINIGDIKQDIRALRRR